MPCVWHPCFGVLILASPPRSHVPPQCRIGTPPAHPQFPVAVAVFHSAKGQHLGDGFLNLWRDQIVARFVGIKFLTLC